ncbi:MAG: M23 family metallopeptidase, partial [Chloroflexota bacterium]
MRRKRPTATPTATSTPKPKVNLQAEDSIAPVTCSGPSKPNARKPFLTPPYHGWTSIASYFDHDLPDYSQDGLVVTAGGLSARPDATHHATDFPAYWNLGLRQYLYYDGHNGYDYDAYYQPIYAAASGTVIYAAPEYAYALNHGYGNMVMIDHHNGYVTLYGHFSKLLVQKGEKVRRGEEIGISGDTGHSSGPHVHFTVFHNCSPTDPYGWSGPGIDPLYSYQQEQSTWLWIRQPLVSNPLPGYPGIAQLPAPPFSRIVMLRLPAASGGTTKFITALNGEISLMRRDLGATHTSPDAALGAVKVDSRIAPARLFRLPNVVSIASSDSVADARTDLLSALARAAAVNLTGRRRTPEHPDLLRWDGQTFLLGSGRQVRLPANERLPNIHGAASGGAYAADLG